MADMKHVEEDNYGRQVLLITLVLFIILMGIFYKIQQKVPQDPVANSAFVPIVKNQQF